jgi:hypothetical protein
MGAHSHLSCLKAADALVQNLSIWQASRNSILSKIKKKPEVIPSTEPVNHITCCDLVRGANYLVKEAKPEVSFETFVSFIKSRCLDCDHPEAFPCESIGCEACTLPCTCKECSNTRSQGLCFTMRSPEEIRQKYVLQTTPIFWISSHGTDSISPTSLEMIADIISRFLKRSKNPVILLDGIEYLVIANGFIPVLKFLRDIQEWMILNKAIYIMPVNPAALEEKELALIERNMKEIDIQNK